MFAKAEYAMSDPRVTRENIRALYLNIRIKLSIALSYIWSKLVDLLVLILYYIPILRTKFVEAFTFYIPLMQHLTPIRINENEYIFITNSNYGERVRCLINVFYKYYSPFDYRDFIALKNKYMPIELIKFNVYRFSTCAKFDRNKTYSIEFSNDGVKVDGNEIALSLHNVDFQNILDTLIKPIEKKD